MTIKKKSLFQLKKVVHTKKSQILILSPLCWNRWNTDTATHRKRSACYASFFFFKKKQRRKSTLKNHIFVQTWNHNWSENNPKWLAAFYKWMCFPGRSCKSVRLLACRCCTSASRHSTILQVRRRVASETLKWQYFTHQYWKDVHSDRSTDVDYGLSDLVPNSQAKVQYSSTWIR